MIVHAYCETCAHRHRIDFDPLVSTGAFRDWYTRHAGHPGVGFAWPQRTRRWSWVDRLAAGLRWHWRPEREGLYATPTGAPWPVPDALASFLPNADVKAAYAASAAATITLASLAASSTLLAGRESTAIDNGAANKYLDYLFAGNYKTAATSLQAGRIVTGAVAARDDTPTWPDVFDGTDSVETITVQAMADAILRILSDIATDATQRTWPWGKVSLIASMGLSVPPDQFVIFVSHSAHTTTAAWSATESDHAVKYEGVFVTVI